MIEKLISTFINGGTSFEKSLFENRKIRFLNILFLISILSSETYAFIYFLVDFSLLKPLIICSQFFVIACLFGIYLIRKGKIAVSEHLLSLILPGVTCITTFTQIGTIAYSHFYFLLFAVAPLLIWQLKQVKPIAFYFILNTSLFIYAHFIWEPHIQLIPFPKDAALYVAIFTVVSTFFSLFLCLWINLTQIEENEAQLEVQSIKLKNMVEELHTQQTEILHQKENLNTLNISLNQKNETLAELNATKDKFFSIISHDLRSPFNSIVGFSEVLLSNYSQFTKEQMFDIICNIHKSSEQTYMLLENLLDWARSQTGTLVFKPEYVSLNQLIDETVAISNSAAIKKDIHFDIDIQPDLLVFVDVNMFTSILRNLFSNAIKFSYRSGIITISASKQNSDILISVSDSGIGISDSIKSAIFKISEKRSSPGTEKERGAGIGLMLCKEFVEKHGGFIWAESEIGKGSTFRFTIPCSKPD